MLFDFPAAAAVNRPISKSRLIKQSKTSAALREKLIKEVAKITWAYKLSPESLRLPATNAVPEIEIFNIDLKGDAISQSVLRWIDTAIPYPIVFEIYTRINIKIMAAYKRPSDADKSKWVTDVYFESGNFATNAVRSPLPVALDLGVLYEQMLRSLMPAAAKDGEAIKDQVQRLAVIKSLESQAAKLEAKMHKEKQFNRKVELNSELRQLKQQIGELAADGHG